MNQEMFEAIASNSCVLGEKVCEFLPRNRRSPCGKPARTFDPVHGNVCPKHARQIREFRADLRAGKIVIERGRI